jgi:hypothetical protein
MFRATKRFPLLLVTVLFLIGVTRVRSQQCSSHPDDSTAQFLETFACTVNLSQVFGGGSGSDLYLSSSSGACSGHFEVCVWRTSSQSIDYVIRPSTIAFGGDCDSLVDATSTVQLFDAFATAAAVQGTALGYGPCNSNCSSADQCRVYAASCVLRSGSGTSTSFVACDTNAYCHRVFALCCPTMRSHPTVTQVTPLTTTTCSSTGQYLSGCQVTCP